MAPKDVFILIPGTWSKYVNLPGKRDFADVIKDSDGHHRGPREREARRVRVREDEDGSRDWDEQRNVRGHEKLEKARKGLSPRAFRGNTALPTSFRL